MMARRFSSEKSIARSSGLQVSELPTRRYAHPHGSPVPQCRRADMQSPRHLAARSELLILCVACRNPYTPVRTARKPPVGTTASSPSIGELFGVFVLSKSPELDHWPLCPSLATLPSRAERQRFLLARRGEIVATSRPNHHPRDQGNSGDAAAIPANPPAKRAHSAARRLCKPEPFAEFNYRTRKVQSPALGPQSDCRAFHSLGFPLL